MSHIVFFRKGIDNQHIDILVQGACLGSILPAPDPPDKV